MSLLGGHKEIRQMFAQQLAKSLGAEVRDLSVSRNRVRIGPVGHAVTFFSPCAERQSL